MFRPDANAHAPPPQRPGGLTPAQRERMAANRRAALARLGKKPSIGSPRTLSKPIHRPVAPPRTPMTPASVLDPVHFNSPYSPAAGGCVNNTAGAHQGRPVPVGSQASYSPHARPFGETSQRSARPASRSAVYGVPARHIEQVGAPAVATPAAFASARSPQAVSRHQRVGSHRTAAAVYGGGAQSPGVGAARPAAAGATSARASTAYRHQPQPQRQLQPQRHVYAHTPRGYPGRGPAKPMPQPYATAARPAPQPQPQPQPQPRRYMPRSLAPATARAPAPPCGRGPASIMGGGGGGGGGPQPPLYAAPPRPSSRPSSRAAVYGGGAATRQRATPPTTTQHPTIQPRPPRSYHPRPQWQPHAAPVSAAQRPPPRPRPQHAVRTAASVYGGGSARPRQPSQHVAAGDPPTSRPGHVASPFFGAGNARVSSAPRKRPPPTTPATSTTGVAGRFLGGGLPVKRAPVARQPPATVLPPAAAAAAAPRSQMAIVSARPSKTQAPLGSGSAQPAGVSSKASPALGGDAAPTTKKPSGPMPHPLLRDALNARGNVVIGKCEVPPVDALGKRPGEPGFCATTLCVPQRVLSRISATMRQYWRVKAKHLDMVVVCKVGSFYEVRARNPRHTHKEHVITRTRCARSMMSMPMCVIESLGSRTRPPTRRSMLT